jgi:hypothetical protein
MSAAAEADLLPKRRPGRQYEERSRWTKPSDNLVSLIPPRDPGNGGSAA